MNRDVFHVLPCCSFYEAVKMLDEMNISCLLVVDEEKNLQGIVTVTDVVVHSLLAACMPTAKSRE